MRLAFSLPSCSDFFFFSFSYCLLEMKGEILFMNAHSVTGEVDCLRCFGSFWFGSACFSDPFLTTSTEGCFFLFIFLISGVTECLIFSFDKDFSKAVSRSLWLIWGSQFSFRKRSASEDIVLQSPSTQELRIPLAFLVKGNSLRL